MNTPYLGAGNGPSCGLSGRTLRPVPFSQITLDPSQSTFLLTDILLVTGVIFGGMSTPPVLIPEK